MTLCDPMDCSTPGFPALHYLLEFAQIHVQWLNNATQPFHPPSAPPLLLPIIFPSIRVLSSDSALCIRWPKYWSFSISPSSEYSGLISFRIDWFDLLAVQGALKNLLQHHSLKASVFQQKGAQASLWSTLTSIHDYQMQVILHTLVLRCITVSRVGKVITLSLLLLYVRKRRFRGVIII